MGVLLTLAGLAALWFFYSQNEILLSGDAVAHINIARRVFDSRTPGLFQLGSVWLPLPHLLTIPFIINRHLWQTGIGGAILSVISYVLAGVGIFRLLSIWSRPAAWVGVAVFAGNPNLLFVETTALNEPLYLATFLWATYFLVRARRAMRSGDSRAGIWLQRGSMALAAAILTRYDGWFLAALCWLAVLPESLHLIHRLGKPASRQFRRRLQQGLLLTALAPALWFAYNFGVYGNALEFANGPYSARAIAQRTASPDARYPGKDHLWTASVYFLKAAQLNVGPGRSAMYLVLLAAAGGLVFAVRTAWLPVALMWSPLLFYALSIAYGSVPIFLPVWWPFSYYNVRYGLEMLPAVAAGLGWLAAFLANPGQPRSLRAMSLGLIVLMTAISYAEAVHRTPICLREVRANGSARLEFDHRLAAVLETLPAQSTILAYTGAHAGAFELAGVPLSRTINEGIFVIWNISLQHPAASAEYVVASDGDPVADAVKSHPSNLRPITTIEVSGQPRTLVYKSERP